MHDAEIFFIIFWRKIKHFCFWTTQTLSEAQFLKKLKNGFFFSLGTGFKCNFPLSHSYRDSVYACVLSALSVQGTVRASPVLFIWGSVKSFAVSLRRESCTRSCSHHVCWQQAFVHECLGSQIIVKITSQILHASLMRVTGNILILQCQILCWLMHSMWVSSCWSVFSCNKASLLSRLLLVVCGVSVFPCFQLNPAWR